MAKFCCRNMNYYATKGKNIEYQPSSRLYLLHLKYIDDEDYGSAQQLWYCPWCGTKLPKELGDEWMDTLYNEYGLKSPCEGDEDADKVPEEFKSDKWWKKRGL